MLWLLVKNSVALMISSNRWLLKLEMTNYDLYSPKTSLSKDSVNCGSTARADLEMGLDVLSCKIFVKTDIKSHFRLGKSQNGLNWRGPYTSFVPTPLPCTGFPNF